MKRVSALAALVLLTGACGEGTESAKTTTAAKTSTESAKTTTAAKTSTKATKPTKQGRQGQPFAGKESTYELGYQLCGIASVRAVAEEYGAASNHPLDAAEAYGRSFRPGFRVAATAGCLDAFLKRPPQVK